MNSDEKDPPRIESPLSQSLTRHGLTVTVEIYGDGEGKWILEVVNPQNVSYVWDDHFETDRQALQEAIRALEEETVDFMDLPPETGNLH